MLFQTVSNISSNHKMGSRFTLLHQTNVALPRHTPGWTRPPSTTCTALTDLIGMAKRVETDDKSQQCLGFEINEARACCPHGMILLDEKFTKIANKLVHRFHVVHNEELAHIAVNGKPPRADLWVGGDDNYFMTPNTVNEGLSSDF